MIAEPQNKKAANAYKELIFLIELCEFQRKNYPEALDYFDVMKRIKEILNK